MCSIPGTALLAGLVAVPLGAQQTIGTVAMEDATVAGDLSVTGARATLRGTSSVTAKDHTAEVTLTRGGLVRVCATSGLHLTQSSAASAVPEKALMLALDRGAIEVQTRTAPQDAILTPDLRFAAESAGVLDLRLRVTRNGDTCVENRGAGAPTIAIEDPFTGSRYQIKAGQHVLFEHGSLKEVVDQETSPCGCPPATAIAGNTAASGPAANGAAATAAEQHPFPAAISQGLAPPPAVPQAAPGAPHAQVATSVGFEGNGSGTIDGTPVAASVPVAAASGTTAKPPARGFGHRIGRFFKRIFGG